MNDQTPSNPPGANFIRLGGSHHDFLENLGSLGPIYLQARNQGGGLGKHVESCQPLLVPQMTYAVDPDAGLAISLDEFIAIHATTCNTEAHPSPAFDLEFSSFPAGLSLVEIPGLSKNGCVREYAKPFGGMPVSGDELERWRREIAPPTEICKNCEQAGDLRAENPQSHPLYRIFEYAWKSGIDLNVRLVGEHVDLVTSFAPSSIYPISGFVIVSDLKGTSVLHLNLKWVHAFQMKVQQIDGSPHSCIRVFDMHGNHNFEINAEGAEHLRFWREISKQSDSKYQERRG